ncbi:hypothetical protein GCM10010168_47180 [Actinoplanes ianthinogenes]|nr:hypothetical protein GCM10010168_47180 [Actinoplanes ianthinogenes]
MQQQVPAAPHLAHPTGRDALRQLIAVVEHNPRGKHRAMLVGKTKPTLTVITQQDPPSVRPGPPPTAPTPSRGHPRGPPATGPPGDRRAESGGYGTCAPPRDELDDHGAKRALVQVANGTKVK